MDQKIAEKTKIPAEFRDFLGARKKLASKAGKLALKTDILPSEKIALSKNGQERLNGNLLDATVSGNISGVSRLVKAGADLDAGDDCGLTALMLAASKGDIQICRLLIRNGADVDVRDNTNRTALMLAAKNGHADVCRLLIGKGAEPLARDWREKTVLHYAAAARRMGNICMLLVEKGVNDEATDRDGRTALMDAAEEGRTKACAMLCELKSDKKRKGLINAKDNDGQTAAMIAKKNRHYETASLIRAWEPECHESLSQYLRRRSKRRQYF